MEVALSQFLVLGVVTNLPLLREVMRDPQFQMGEYDTVSSEWNPAVTSPAMPDAVLEVLVGEGDWVQRNQTVIIMESMKMELVITAFRSGVVRRVVVEPGQQVDRGMRLLELAPETDAGE